MQHLAVWTECGVLWVPRTRMLLTSNTIRTDIVHSHNKKVVTHGHGWRLSESMKAKAPALITADPKLACNTSS
jgi:hypothetical protein